MKQSNYNINAAKWYDLTQVINPSMIVYPGDPQPLFEPFLTIAKNGANVSRFLLGSHTGTHIDAPSHFLSNGNTVENEMLDKFVGEAVILDLSSVRGRGITGKDLDGSDVVKGDILLIYTGTGSERTNFSYLEADAAQWIVDHGVKAVGLDTLSVEKYGSHEAPVHNLLLKNSVGIIENLSSKLQECINKRMFLICFSLPLKGLDGSPARAVLFEIKK